MKVLYWIGQCTWGLLMNIIGFIACIFLFIGGYECRVLRHSFCFIVGKGWGGLTLGAVIIVSEDCSTHTIHHEYGHTIQNLIFGPFEAFIGIASASRYWYRELKYYRRHKYPPTKYDDAWFEGQATALGEQAFNKEKLS